MENSGPLDLDVVPKGDGGDWFVNGQQTALAEKWLTSLGVKPEEATESLITALTAKVPIVSLSCPGCHKLHLDSGAFAKKAHETHCCQFCNQDWKVWYSAVSNPLAKLQPLLVGGKVLFADMTRTFRHGRFGGPYTANLVDG